MCTERCGNIKEEQKCNITEANNLIGRMTSVSYFLGRNNLIGRMTSVSYFLGRNNQWLKEPKREDTQSGEKQENTFTHHTMQLKGWRNWQTSAQKISKASRSWLYHTEKDKYCIVSFIRESKINKRTDSWSQRTN